MNYTLNTLPYYLTEGDFFKNLTEDGQDMNEELFCPFKIPENQNIITNMEEFINLCRLEDYFHLYEYSTSLHVYAHLNYEEIQDLIEKDHIAKNIFHEILSSGFIVENKREVINFINKYGNIPNKNSVIQEIKDTALYSFKITETEYSQFTQYNFIILYVNNVEILKFRTELFFGEQGYELLYFNPERMIFDIENNRTDDYYIHNLQGGFPRVADQAFLQFFYSENTMEIYNPEITVKLKMNRFNKYYCIQSLKNVLSDMIKYTKEVIDYLYEDEIPSFVYTRGIRINDHFIEDL